MQNFERLSNAREAAIFKHHAAIGNFFQRVQIVSRHDHGFRAVGPG